MTRCAQTVLLPLVGFLLNCSLLVEAELTVPKISDVPRVDREARPSEEAQNTSCYILKTSPHSTLGNAYVIVTDQTDPSFLNSLNRLSKFHQGTIIHVPDLGALRTDSKKRERLISYLRSAQPRYVAVAPKLEGFTEDTVLGVWAVLTSLGNDRKLPVFPGFLVAPTPTAFDHLVDRSLDYAPETAAQIHLFVIGQVAGPDTHNLRSLQKLRMMRRLFASYGCGSHSLITLDYPAVAAHVPVAPAPGQAEVGMVRPNQWIETIPPHAKLALDNASLLLMFGHGGPGMVCSIDDNAFRDVLMTGKIVMSGDCFSAAPSISAKTESFAMRVLENGADVVYAHMHLNEGFPHLFPVLEGWMDGLTVGEAYQRQINALLDYNDVSPDDLIEGSLDRTNDLLYVVIGDPALQPFAKMVPKIAGQ